MRAPARTMAIVRATTIITALYSEDAGPKWSTSKVAGSRTTMYQYKPGFEST